MADPADLPDLLGALALAVSDAVAARLAALSDLGPSAVAAIVTLGHRDGMTLRALAQVLSLSAPATVRMIDALHDKGLVTRGAGRDARSIALRLTPQGAALRTAMAEARADVLHSLVAALPHFEQRALTPAIAALLARAAPDAATRARAHRLG